MVCDVRADVARLDLEGNLARHVDGQVQFMLELNKAVGAAVKQGKKLEEIVPPGTKSWFHLHHDSDEVAYVLSGEVVFSADDAVAADFLDVPDSDSFHDYVEAIVRAGITAGCGGGIEAEHDLLHPLAHQRIDGGERAAEVRRQAARTSYPKPCTGGIAGPAPEEARTRLAAALISSST